MQLNSLTVKVYISVNSKDFVFPINNNISISLFNDSNVTINADASFLPGVEIYVGKDASVMIAEEANVFVYDRDEWKAGNYAGQKETYKSIVYSPTKKYTRQDADLKDVELNINGTVYVNGNLYTTNGGADIKSSEETGKFLYGAKS